MRGKPIWTGLLKTVGMLSRIITQIMPVLLICISIFVLWRTFHALHARELREYVRGLSYRGLGLAVGLTILNYIVLTFYDALAVIHLGKKLPLSKTAMASFLSWVFSYNLGFAFLSGSIVRFRMYSRWGMGALDIGRLILFCTATGWLGFLMVGGFALSLKPHTFVKYLPYDFPSAQPLGIAMMGFVVIGWVAAKVRPSILGLKDWWPTEILYLGQTVISTLDWFLGGCILYNLLPVGIHPSLFRFLNFYVLSQVAAAASHAPAGLGVLEASLVLFMSPYLQPWQVLGAVLVYRLIYLFIPLGVALPLYGIVELHSSIGTGRQWNIQGRKIVAKDVNTL